MYGKIAALVNPNQKIEYPPLEGMYKLKIMQISLANFMYRC